MAGKRAIIIITLMLSIFLPGCWSRTEIESLAIIGGLGVDKVEQDGKERFVLSAEIIRPALAGGTQSGGGGEGKPVYWRVSSVGDTFSDAERNLNLRIPRRVFYGHLKFVLINEKLARHGLGDVFDYLSRNMRIRPRVMVLVTSEKASDELNKFAELETTVARQIEEMQRIATTRSSKALIMDLAKTTDQLVTPGLDPLIARLSSIQSPPTVPGGDPIEVFRMTGGGAFQVDKFVGWLDDDETRGYLLGTGRAKSGPFSLKLYPHATRDVAIMMTRATSKLKVETGDEEITANIEITAEGDLSEFHRSEEIATKEGIELLEKKFGEAIEKDVMKAVKKSQKLKSDIFGFGAAIHRSNPKEWKKIEKQWYDVLPKLKVKLKVDASIRRTGMIGEPFKPE